MTRRIAAAGVRVTTLASALAYEVSRSVSPPSRLEGAWRLERLHANVRASRPAGITMIVVGALLLLMELRGPSPIALFHSLYFMVYIVLVAAGIFVTSAAFLFQGRVRGLAPYAAGVGVILTTTSLCILDQLAGGDFSALVIGLFSMVVLFRSPFGIHAGRNLLVVVLCIGGVSAAKAAPPDPDLVVIAVAAYGISMVSALILERYALGAFVGRVLLRERNTELNKLSFHDSLTGLYNRRFFEETLTRSAASSRRLRSPLSAIIFDVDRFKNVNDTAGHQTGDQVLCSIARVIGASVRDSDVAARYGGEEFAVLLPNTKLSDAVRVAERVRASLAAVAHAGVLSTVTASAGVAELSDGEAMDDFLRRADQNLYAAKRGGRNRVGGTDVE